MHAACFDVLEIDETGRRRVVQVYNNVPRCTNCKAEKTIVEDYRAGHRVCTACGEVQHGAVLDERPCLDDIDPRNYQSRNTHGPSRAVRSEANARTARAGSIKVATLPRDLRAKFYEDSRAGKFTIRERAHNKNIEYLRKVEKHLNALLSYKFFGLHVHNDEEYIIRAGVLQSPFSVEVLRRIFDFAQQIPMAVWAINDRPMGAVFYVAAGVYLACLHLRIPMRISHLATCLRNVSPNCGHVTRIERKITACVRRVTDEDGFFSEIKIPYEEGVVQVMHSMLLFPEVPRALSVLGRPIKNSDGSNVFAVQKDGRVAIVRGEPKLTKMQQALQKMDYEERRKLMPRPPPELHDDFVSECEAVWSTFLRLSAREIRCVETRAIKERVTHGHISKATHLHVKEVESHRFRGGARRTKNIAGIAQGNFTANVERMAVAVIMTVVMRPGGIARYGCINWAQFNFKTCQTNRIKGKITRTLQRHKQLMVGAIRDVPRQQSIEMMAASAARAALASVGALPMHIDSRVVFGYSGEKMKRQRRVDRRVGRSVRQKIAKASRFTH